MNGNLCYMEYNITEKHLAIFVITYSIDIQFLNFLNVMQTFSKEERSQNYTKHKRFKAFCICLYREVLQLNASTYFSWLSDTK